MKLVRKKIGDRNYNLVDSQTGEVIANAVQTGERGRDDYPWEWNMLDGRIFGKLDYTTGRSVESLKDAVDYVESGANSFGILKPVGRVNPLDLKKGQVFQTVERGIRFFYRAEVDVDTFNSAGDSRVLFEATNSKGELKTMAFSAVDRVTLYK